MKVNFKLLHNICTCIALSIFTSCANKSAELPILSYNYKDGKKVIYKIDDFEFINQNGHLITADSTKGIVHTMNFFFTTCPSICPPMRLIQSDLADTFSDEKHFKQYGITMDLKRDTLQQLKYYAATHDIHSKHWQLLRAHSEAQLQAMANALKTNFKPNEDDSDFYHSSYVALIDKQQHIRGFYNLLVPQEVTLLKSDIQTLLKR
ncbi:SCO family protein [Psychroserpens sp. BH13MA-6]